MQKKQIILAIDSAGSFLKISLFDGSTIYKTQKNTIKQEKYLFGLIDKLLFKAKLTFEDINTVCVLKGPGRFTGIRIGLTLAGIMRQLKGCRVFSINILSALAFEASETADFEKWYLKNNHGLIASVMHAFREEYYLEFFELNSKNEIYSVGKPLWLVREELEKTLKKQKIPLLLVGWAENYAPLNKTIKSTKIKILKPAVCGLNPDTMIEMVRTNTCLHKDLKPFYLKKARFETQ